MQCTKILCLTTITARFLVRLRPFVGVVIQKGITLLYVQMGRIFDESLPGRNTSMEGDERRARLEPGP